MSQIGLVSNLTAAIDGLLAVDTADVSDDDLGAALVELRHQKARLCAAEAKLSRAHEPRRAWAKDGSKSPGAWLKRHANCSLKSASHQFTFARRLATMPLVRAALAAGEIDEQRAEILAKLADSPRDAIRAAFADSEELLVGFAKRMDFGGFRSAIEYWKQGADPDGSDTDADKTVDERNLFMTKGLDDRWFLQGELDPVSGQIVYNEIARIYDELFTEDWNAAKAEHGDDITVDKLARTPRQRRADALIEMARRSAAKPADAEDARVLLTVLVGYETFAGRVCELADGTVIAPGQLVPLLKTDPWVERVVFGPDKRPMEVSERTRFFTGALRRGLEVRDRRCAHPGCDELAENCDADHIVPWSRGGPTTADNGRLYCPFHHRWHHRHGHQQDLFRPTGTDPPPGPNG